MKEDKVNYEIFWDDENSSIFESSKEVDNEDVFPTFDKAKAALLKIFRKRIATYRNSISIIKELKNTNS